MRWLFIIRLAIANLMAKKLRTGLTVGGIALSVGVMVFLLGLGNGLQRSVTSEIARSGSQEVISVSSKRTKQLKLDSSAISRLTSISGVSDVEQLVGLTGRVTYHGISLDAPVYAVSAGYMETTPHEMIAGSLFSTRSSESKEIVISSRALQALGISNPREAIGREVALELSISKDWATNQEDDTVEVIEPGYTIVGVIEKSGAPVVYTLMEYVQQHGVNIAAEVKLVVTIPSKITEVRETVEQLGFQTSSIRDTIDQVNRIFGVIETILVVFGGITLVIAIFGTLNTITIALVEQTRQVGFLRILGIRKRDVRRLFMLQSILLSTSGVFFGICLGSFLGLVCNSVVWQIAQNNGVSSWQLFQFPILFMLFLILCSVGLGWVLGLGPAKRAVSLRPLEALRV